MSAGLAVNDNVDGVTGDGTAVIAIGGTGIHHGDIHSAGACLPKAGHPSAGRIDGHIRVRRISDAVNVPLALRCRNADVVINP